MNGRMLLLQPPADFFMVQHALGAQGRITPLAIALIRSKIRLGRKIRPSYAVFMFSLCPPPIFVVERFVFTSCGYTSWVWLPSCNTSQVWSASNFTVATNPAKGKLRPHSSGPTIDNDQLPSFFS
jgi:hypothetical protein